MTDGIFDFDPSHELRILGAEHKIIEAAKALRQAELMPGVATYFAIDKAKRAFNEAVEALQELEKGDE